MLVGGSAWAQDECEGAGNDIASLQACLQQMWNEKNNSNCAGCVGCTAFGGACPGCDYKGAMGPECGHYLNMSAPYFTQVACGFAGKPPGQPDGSWAVQNFQ
jgi:hypothetical protein